MRALLAPLLLAGCVFDASGGSGGGSIDGGGTPDAAVSQVDGALAIDAEPPPTCETPWVLETTGCYQYIKDATASFDNAQADCVTRGGHLVVEDKQDEFLVVATGMAPLSDTDRFWIGLHDPPPDDNTFVWVTGLRLVDPHWAGTEPSNSGDCVNSRNDGIWGDRNCAELKWYACEKND